MSRLLLVADSDSKRHGVLMRGWQEANVRVVWDGEQARPLLSVMVRWPVGEVRPYLAITVPEGVQYVVEQPEQA